MKNALKLSHYLFTWYWKKWGKAITISSLLLGAVTIFGMMILHGDPNNYEYFSKYFRSYDVAVDQSFLLIIFPIGLFTIVLTLFLQIRSFSNNGKGIYTLFTLPVKRKEAYFSFALCGIAAIALYYILWLLLVVLAYFPVTILYEYGAASEILYLSDGQTITNLPTHLQNGLFLAFRRSLFLSTFFPSSLWMIPSLIVGLLFWLTAILFGGFYRKDMFTCGAVSILSFVAGCYLIFGTTIHRLSTISNELFLGNNIVIAVVGGMIVFFIQSYMITRLEEDRNGLGGAK